MNIPRIEHVKPQEGHILLISFTNGKKKKYDINRLLNKDMSEPLKNQAFFNNVHVEPGGYAVAWNSEIDISEYELWQHGEATS
jgi:hypothetical protein